MASPQQPQGFVPDGFTPDPPTTLKSLAGRSFDHLWNFGAEALSTVNPAPLVKLAWEGGGNPVGMGAKMAEYAMPELFKGIDAYKAGDTKTATRQFTKVIPLLGGVADRAWELVETKQWDRLAGLVAGLAAPKVAGAVLPKSLASTGAMRSNNASVARSTDFALNEGIPLPLDAATGNKMISYVKTASDAASLAAFADRVTPVAKGFTKTGAKLATEIKSGLTRTAESAGSAVRGAVERVVAKYKAASDTSYDTLRAIEAKNAQDVPMFKDGKPIMRQVGESGGKPVMEQVVKTIEAPVDVTALKDALRPVFDKIKSDAYYTTTKKMSDPGFKALQTIVNGPDTVALSDLRGMRAVLGKEQVGTEAMGQRTSGQGLAAHAGGIVRNTVAKAIRTLGKDAEKALAEGDFNYRHMKNTTRMFEQVQSSKGAQEPVQLFNRLVQPGDANVATLRKVQAVAPGEMQTLGRAWFEDRMMAATTREGMEHTAKMLAEWDKMGPKTREILFPDAAVRQRVGDFFAAMERWGKSPNPSGTGGMNALMQMLVKTGGVVGGAAGANYGGGLKGLIAEQALLTGANVGIYSPTAVRALVQGFTLPVSGPVAGAAALGIVSKQPAPGPNVPTMRSPAAVAPSQEQAPDVVLQAEPGIHTLSDGSVWRKDANGTIRKLK